MNWGDVEWPHVLLAGMAVVTVAAVVVGASTTTVAFSAYNYEWDGTSELQKQADAVGAESTVLRNVSEYGSAPPNETVAVVLSPDEEYGPEEASRIRQFLERGGTLVVADDFGSNANPLLASLGVTARIDGTPVRDERNNFRSSALVVANNVTDDPLTRGVPGLVLNHGSVVRPGEATILVNTSSYAYLDRNRNGAIDPDESLERRPVATVERIGSGEVIVVSDPSVFINSMLERPGNRAFVRNLFRTSDHVLIDHSHSSEIPSLPLAVLVVRGSPIAQVGLGTLGLAFIAAWSRYRPTGYVRERLRRTSNEEPATLSTEDVVTAVGRRHPEWDENRVRRVVQRLDRTDDTDAVSDTDGD
jgi:hypothetical protein